jgi:hypothetical protein
MKNIKGDYHNNRTGDHDICFEAHDMCNLPCNKGDCRYWIKKENDLNCTILSARNGQKTLQEIGDIFEVTRMRICQIEKLAIKKLVKKKSIKF